MDKKNTRRRYSAIDLFSGCGGLTLGLKQAGFRVIGAVDNDPLSVQTYKANHHHVIVWERDIRKLSVREVKDKLRLKRGDLDLLAGCPPCQAFSTIRTRNRQGRIRDKETKDLVLEFLRFIRGLRPKVVMMENVPGLGKDRRIKVLRRKLRRLGYWSDFRILDAAKYGVPQRRRRLLLFAARKGPIAFAAPAQTIRTVRDAIGSLRAPARSRDRLHRVIEKRSERIRVLIRRIPRNGGSRSALGRKSQLACHQQFDGFRDVYGRMRWEEVAPTITSGCLNPSKGRFLHPTQNRAITLREATLLQSFPRTYFFPLDKGRYAAAALLGNALPPAFVRRHSLKIIEHLCARASTRK